MKIAILGFGTVGQGVYKICQEEKARYRARIGQDLDVKKVLVRDPDKDRGMDLPIGLLTSDIQEILEDPEIELVVEVTSGKDQAISYIKQVLTSGKHLVSANKVAIAADFKELQELAAKKQVHLKFEASVAAGIPILAPLVKLLAFNNIYKLHGIINSTTNYVLTEICQGKDLDQVLLAARELGILEEDPTDDLAGFDARRKLAILAMLILDQEISEADIFSFGISQLDSRDTAILGALGYEIKLLAEFLKGREGGLTDGEYALSVLPTALKNSKFNRVNGLFNEVALQGSQSGELRFLGAGGSMRPTANSIMTDILDVLTSKPTYHLLENDSLVDISETRSSAYYIRLPGELLSDRKLVKEVQNVAIEVLSDRDELAVFCRPLKPDQARQLYGQGAHLVKLGETID